MPAQAGQAAPAHPIQETASCQLLLKKKSFMIFAPLQGNWIVSAFIFTYPNSEA